jgi:hypothetical protein
MDFRLLISVEPALELETALGQTSDQDIAINSSSTSSAFANSFIDLQFVFLICYSIAFSAIS